MPQTHACAQDVTKDARMKDSKLANPGGLAAASKVQTEFHHRLDEEETAMENKPNNK